MLHRLRCISAVTTSHLRPRSARHMVQTLRMCRAAKRAVSRRSRLSGSAPSPCRPYSVLLSFRSHRQLCRHVGQHMSNVLHGNLLRRTRHILRAGPRTAIARTVKCGRFHPCFRKRYALRRAISHLGRRAHHCTGERLS